MLEDIKSGWFLGLLAILIGIGYAANHLTAVDSANASLQESKSKLADLAEVVALRKKLWADTEQGRQRHGWLVHENQSLTIKKEALEQRAKDIEAGFLHAVSSMQTARETVRKNAAATVLGELHLENGKTLREAKIRKVDDLGVSIVHSEGIGTFTPQMLPSELNKRFDLGAVTLLQRLRDALAGYSGAHSHEVPSQSQTTNTDGLRLKIAALESRIDADTKFVAKLEKEVKELEDKIRDLEFRGAPAQNLKTMRDIAEGNAGMARNELRLKKAELDRLKSQLTSKKSSASIQLPRRLEAETTAVPKTGSTIAKNIMLRMAELSSRIEALERSAKQLRQDASKHHELVVLAKKSGQPSTRHQMDAAAANEEAARLAQQAAIMREELSRLDVDLAYAQ